MTPTTMGDDDHAFLRSKTRPQYERGVDPVRIVDLFCGCGGMTLGAAEAARAHGRGTDVRLAVERDPRIYPLYRANFTPSVDLGPQDIRQVLNGGANGSLRRRVGPVDVMVGGPPCQGHSNLNNHTRGRDPKNALYLEMAHAADLLRPRHLVIENVSSVLQAKEGVVLAASDRLTALGYTVAQGIISVARLGIPQLRKRHVLVASISTQPDIESMLRESCPERPRDLRWAIGDLDRGMGDSMFDTPSTLSPDNLRRATWMSRHGEYDLPNRLRPRCHRDSPGHRYKSMYGRLDWRLPAHTITSGFLSPGQGRYLHPTRIRTLTPHEAARLQFFPDWFDFSGAVGRTLLAETIGNAVPSKLAFAIVGHLLRRESAVESSRQASAG